MCSTTHAFPDLIVLRERNDEPSTEELTSHNVARAARINVRAADKKFSGNLMTTDDNDILASHVEAKHRTCGCEPNTM